MCANVNEDPLLIVNGISGEIVGKIPLGSKIVTPQQAEIRKKYTCRQNTCKIRKNANSELGYFYFIYREHQLGNISAETVGRFIY